MHVCGPYAYSAAALAVSEQVRPSRVGGMHVISLISVIVCDVQRGNVATPTVAFATYPRVQSFSETRIIHQHPESKMEMVGYTSYMHHVVCGCLLRLSHDAHVTIPPHSVANVATQITKFCFQLFFLAHQLCSIFKHNLPLPTCPPTCSCPRSLLARNSTKHSFKCRACFKGVFAKWHLFYPSHL